MGFLATFQNKATGVLGAILDASFIVFQMPFKSFLMLLALRSLIMFDLLQFLDSFVLIFR